MNKLSKIKLEPGLGAFYTGQPTRKWIGHIVLLPGTTWGLRYLRIYSLTSKSDYYQFAKVFLVQNQRPQEVILHHHYSACTISA